MSVNVPATDNWGQSKLTKQENKINNCENKGNALRHKELLKKYPQGLEILNQLVSHQMLIF